MDLSLRDQLAAHLDAYEHRMATSGQTARVNAPGRVSYGTAGFRGEADKIEHIFFNVGLVAALRCIQLGKHIGVMITASHNPVRDNGVKFIDPSGEMLEHQWECIVEELCNIHGRDAILAQLDKLVSALAIDTRSPSKGKVFIGMDTRPSSESLVALVSQGIGAWNPLVTQMDFGQVTTPVLHYLVAESNIMNTGDPIPLSRYYDQLTRGFVDIFSQPQEQTKTDEHTPAYSSAQLVVDCANGVGFKAMLAFSQNQEFASHLPVELINSGEGILNKDCGADFVKSTGKPPTGARNTSKRYAALDGDADRLVYFYLNEKATGDDRLELELLDGDKIMTLIVMYLKEMLVKCNLEGQLSLGAVQTAYANGASTDYIEVQLGVKVDCVDTGVKNLHHQAVNYDLGVYFEANGHGTVWISKKAREATQLAGDQAADLRRLFAIINNYTGDAISDILVVETILRYFGWDAKKWQSLYRERPNCLTKVEVPDRSIIKTTNAGRTCIEPVELQPMIDSIVSQYGSGSRCFVRPSGTENVVRIYAEAVDREAVEKLAAQVGEQVKQICSR